MFDRLCHRIHPLRHWRQPHHPFSFPYHRRYHRRRYQYSHGLCRRRHQTTGTRQIFRVYWRHCRIRIHHRTLTRRTSLPHFALRPTICGSRINIVQRCLWLFLSSGKFKKRASYGRLFYPSPQSLCPAPIYFQKPTTEISHVHWLLLLLCLCPNARYRIRLLQRRSPFLSRQYRSLLLSLRYRRYVHARLSLRQTLTQIWRPQTCLSRFSHHRLRLCYQCHSPDFPLRFSFSHLHFNLCSRQWTL